MGRWFALAALALLSACATAAPRTFSGSFERPASDASVLIMTPNVQLSMLLATGLEEPRANWSISGRDNLATSLSSQLGSRGHPVSTLDADTAMEGRQGQIIRLHSAVGSSIIANDYSGMPLPTRKNRFDWTLGPGASEIAEQHNAQYALFVSAHGSYASSGRVIAMIGMAALGAAIPLGSQQAFASLVDLRTGNIIWFNAVTAAPDQDMRSAEGADRLTRLLLKDIPL